MSASTTPLKSLKTVITARPSLQGLCLTVAVSVFSMSCDKGPQPGYLNISTPGSGSYEIYRIANESPLQFVSEQAGRFNEEIALTPGSYLVLADCSSETVIIRPGLKEQLTAHRLEFVAPHQPADNDSFSIQCSRSEKTRSRQHIANRFELNLIHGKRDLLVGMVPMHVDFTAMAAPEHPKSLSYKLSAVKIERNDERFHDISYFVSPVDELVSVTKYQKFGAWEFLLPGRYMLEVNGTRMQVELAEGEERIIKPAMLSVTTSPSIDLNQPARIKGSPWLVEINGGHWLNFNEIYPVLPGKITVGINGSTQTVDIELVEDASTELKARSVTVATDCSDADYSCLGNRDVALYLAEEPYPFLESVSDIPILFIEKNEQSFLVQIEGSRDITYTLPNGTRDKHLQLGYLRLEPQPTHKLGQVTDLMRVDTLGPPFLGHTLDLNLERTTLMPLVAGTYKLEHFLTNTSIEGDRRNQARHFTIEPGKTLSLDVPVYFSEKRLGAYRKKREQEEAQRAAKAAKAAREAGPPPPSGLKRG